MICTDHQKLTIGTKRLRDTEASKDRPVIDDFAFAKDLFTIRIQSVNALLVKATSKVWAVGEFRTGTIAVLSLIVNHPGISQNEIAAKIVVDKSAVNGIVNSLEALGWAERRKSSTDKRRHAIHATSAGVDALADIISQIRKVETRLLAHVPSDLLIQLQELLDQVHASCLAALNR